MCALLSYCVCRPTPSLKALLKAHEQQQKQCYEQRLQHKEGGCRDCSTCRL